jgi:predicted dehydrogenase
MNVGIIGLGFMGMIHYLAYKKVRGVKITAMCETDPVRLSGDWRTIKGNFGPQGTMMDLSGIDRYPELQGILADPKVEMVDICLPPAAHAKTAVAALEAGKHVFCEKPIALKPADAERMVAAANAAGKLLAIGHVLPFFPEYNFAYKAITGGKYGRLLGGYFKRIISDPAWMTEFYNPNVTGGPMIDLHIHDAHFIRLICGMPKAVHTQGRMRGEVLESFISQYYFDDPNLLVSAACGVINQQGRAFTHGFEIYLEKATLLFDFSVIGDQAMVTMPLTVLDAKGKAQRPELGSDRQLRRRIDRGRPRHPQRQTLGLAQRRVGPRRPDPRQLRNAVGEETETGEDLRGSVP